jgi:hypothetical protein
MDASCMAAMGLPAAFGRPARKRRRPPSSGSAVSAAAAVLVDPLLRDGRASAAPQSGREISRGRSSQGFDATAPANSAGWFSPGSSDRAGSKAGADAAARWLQLIRSSTQRTRMRAAKDLFETVDPSLFKRARAATNPYECLGSGPFVCRSALKLVEMDALCGLTQQQRQTETEAETDRERDRQPERETTSHPDANISRARVPAAMTAHAGPADFTFVDLCGGPGGFSEYLSQKGRGWGITLKVDGGLDWKIGRELSSVAQTAQGPPDELGAGSRDAADATHRFTVSYGADGTGNLYSVENIRHFAAEVATSVPGGVRLVVADGGFNDARNSHDQEVRALRLSALAEWCIALLTTVCASRAWCVRARARARQSIMHRLVLAQLAAMSLVLGEGGAFVLKLFDVETPCTVSNRILATVMSIC